MLAKSLALTFFLGTAKQTAFLHLFLPRYSVTVNLVATEAKSHGLRVTGVSYNGDHKKTGGANIKQCSLTHDITVLSTVKHFCYLL